VNKKGVAVDTKFKDKTYSWVTVRGAAWGKVVRSTTFLYLLSDSRQIEAKKRFPLFALQQWNQEV
jgi:hypothetical protein